jgi:hypothetical protein
MAVTSIYLRRLEGETDRTWQDVASAIGVQAFMQPGGRTIEGQRLPLTPPYPRAKWMSLTSQDRGSHDRSGASD